jgi:hypothetical protein
MVFARPHTVDGSTICDRCQRSRPSLFSAAATSSESAWKMPVLYGSRMVLYSIGFHEFSGVAAENSVRGHGLTIRPAWMKL